MKVHQMSFLTLGSASLIERKGYQAVQCDAAGGSPEESERKGAPWFSLGVKTADTWGGIGEVGRQRGSRYSQPGVDSLVGPLLKVS